MSELPRFGIYKTVSELGAGAIATVYLATQEPLARKVAIKALKSTIPPSSTFAAQLEREARVLSGLSHPNIVLLLDYVKTEAQMYLVLEYISGFSLSELLAKKPKLRGEMVAAIGAEVAQGLAHAHERGVIHRDVKPANVILSRQGEVKIVDFSIAHRERLPSADEPAAFDQSTPAHGTSQTAFGTPAYMAPEQLLGEAVDARSDLFSLGVVLYQLLSGVRPFERPGEKRAPAHAARTSPAVQLRQRAPDVPRALERVVMRCIEKHPADRPTSADAVAEELTAFVRSRTELSMRELVRGALASARLVPGDPPPLVRASEPRPSFFRTPWTLALFGAALGLGLAAVHATDRAAEHAAAASEGPLLPAQRGFLRVLATPWAEVAVDGQRAAITPVARPIPLAPGVHFVRFTHPSAPSQTRRVTIAPNETETLDVTMNIAGQDAGAP
ncbi:MAG TPA: serine/threonine-protein kinase [Polyangiaceae bacterium]|jgi:serine/threonine-protein kinase